MKYKYKVLGVKRVDFIDQKSNEHINGCQLWVLAETADPAWVGGFEVFKIWINFDSTLFSAVMALRTGDEITGDCDRKGRPMTINKV